MNNQPDIPSTVVETSRGVFVACAETLGWAPGSCPKRVTTSVGNREPFVLNNVKQEAGKAIAVFFQQHSNFSLHVFNP
jgi:hypothetical protein